MARLDVHDAPHGAALLEPGQGMTTGEQPFLQAPIEKLLEVLEAHVVGVGVDVVAQVGERGRPVVLRPLGDARGERRQMGAVVPERPRGQALGSAEGQKHPYGSRYFLHGVSPRKCHEKRSGMSDGLYNFGQFKISIKPVIAMILAQWIE